MQSWSGAWSSSRSARVPRLAPGLPASPRQQWRPEPGPRPTSTSRLSGSPRARPHCPSQVAPSPTVRRLFAGSGRLRALSTPTPGALARPLRRVLHCGHAR
jgi:hypothetical protein